MLTCASNRADAEASNGNSFADRLGPVRNGGRGAQRDTTRPTADRQPTRQRNAPPKREKRKPVTAADLDAELEAFMNTSSKGATAENAAVTGDVQPAKAATQDVDMS